MAFIGEQTPLKLYLQLFVTAVYECDHLQYFQRYPPDISTFESASPTLPPHSS